VYVVGEIGIVCSFHDILSPLLESLTRPQGKFRADPGCILQEGDARAACRGELILRTSAGSGSLQWELPHDIDEPGRTATAL